MNPGKDLCCEYGCKAPFDKLFFMMMYSIVNLYIHLMFFMISNPIALFHPSLMELSGFIFQNHPLDSGFWLYFAGRSMINGMIHDRAGFILPLGTLSKGTL